MIPARQKLDTSYQVETPEGVTLDLRLAGPVARSGAWLLDFMIRFAIFFTASLFLARFGDTGMGLLLIGVFLLEWFYPVVFELTWGATPGKKALRLVVIHDNGTPIRWQASLIRNLLRAVDFLPLFYGFGLISMLLNRRFQRLGDIAAGTLVIHVPETERQQQPVTADPVPVPSSLSLDERQAIIAYAERVPLLAGERAVELAEHLEPLTGKNGEAAKERLLGYARWLTRGAE